MARKKFDEAFRMNAMDYCKEHPEKTIKQCAAELGIGYSTLRRWINEGSAEKKDTQPTPPAKKTADVEKTEVPVVEPPVEVKVEEKPQLEEQKVVEEKKTPKEDVVEKPVEEKTPASVENVEASSTSSEDQPSYKISASVSMTVNAEQGRAALYYKKAVLTVKEQLLKRKIKKLLK